MFKIPLDTKKFSQTNKSDRSGNIYNTKNINFSDDGYIKLAHPTVAQMTTDNDADFDTADAMVESDAGIYINSDDEFVISTVGQGTATNLTGGTTPPTPAVEDDVIMFNGVEVVTDGSTLYYQSGSNVWTTVSLSLSTSHPTAMAVFDAKASILVGNNNLVKMLDSTYTTTITLTLPAIYEVTSIDTNANVAYIGTRHLYNGEAKLFTWDGNTTEANNGYGCEANEISSVKKYSGSVACILSSAKLVRFTGSGFEELAVLPIYNKIAWANSLNNNVRVSNRGMTVDGKLIYIRLDSETLSRSRPFISNFQGGVWCFDPAVGLYHKYSPSYTRITSDTIATTDVDTTTNVITVAAAPITGTPCIYDDGSITELAPLKNEHLYYVIKLTATTIKLATTQANALAGTAIDLTGTGNSAQILYFYNTKDYGWSIAGDRGSILKLYYNTNTYSSYAEDIVFTADIKETTLATDKTVFNVVQPKLINRGYFITPLLESENVTDIFQKLYLKFIPLKNDDSIVIKYRNLKKNDYPILGVTNSGALSAGTWTDTDTFTTTVDLSSVEVGDEVEILGGAGAGITAHISSITENAGTYTVNLDEAFIFINANDKCYFSIDNWKKIKTLTATDNEGMLGLSEIALGVQNKWLQLKIELRGIDVTIEELQVINTTNKPSL